jgi:hypothetical protein
MRVVLDTNVLVSAIFFGGIPATILRAARGAHAASIREALPVTEPCGSLHRTFSTLWGGGDAPRSSCRCPCWMAL